MTRLIPMRPAAYPAFFEVAAVAYAADNVAGGRWAPDEAVALAREETARLLPLGADTPGHHLHEIVDDAGGTAGFVWWALSRSGRMTTAFVYQLWVAEDCRRQGHARAAMREVEALATAQGAQRLALHVFAGNAGARALYASLGLQAASLNLAKPLTPVDLGAAWPDPTVGD